MRKTYQGRPEKSKDKFDVLGKRELLVEVPLPLVESWEELQPEVEHLTGIAGLQVIRAVIEDEVPRPGRAAHRNWLNACDLLGG